MHAELHMLSCTCKTKKQRQRLRGAKQRLWQVEDEESAERDALAVPKDCLVTKPDTYGTIVQFFGMEMGYVVVNNHGRLWEEFISQSKMYQENSKDKAETLCLFNLQVRKWQQGMQHSKIFQKSQVVCELLFQWTRDGTSTFFWTNWRMEISHFDVICTSSIRSMRYITQSQVIGFHSELLYCMSILVLCPL